MGDVVDLLAPNPAAGTNAAIAATAAGTNAAITSPAPATFAATIANGNGCGSVGRGPVSAEQANDALRAIDAINTKCDAKSAEKTAKKCPRAPGTKKAENEITSARTRWSDTDRMQLVTMVSALNPCGISKWATLCNDLNEWFAKNDRPQRNADSVRGQWGRIVKAELTAKKPTGSALVSPFRAAVLQAHKNLEDFYATKDSSEAAMQDEDDEDQSHESEDDDVIDVGDDVTPGTPDDAEKPTNDKAPSIDPKGKSGAASGAEAMAVKDSDLAPAAAKKLKMASASAIDSWRGDFGGAGSPASGSRPKANKVLADATAALLAAQEATKGESSSSASPGSDFAQIHMMMQHERAMHNVAMEARDKERERIAEAREKERERAAALDRAERAQHNTMMMMLFAKIAGATVTPDK